MERWTMAVPCLFGLEGLVGDELRRMGMEDVRVEDRRVFFTGRRGRAGTREYRAAHGRAGHDPAGALPGAVV